MKTTRISLLEIDMIARCCLAAFVGTTLLTSPAIADDDDFAVPLEEKVLNTFPTPGFSNYRGAIDGDLAVTSRNGGVTMYARSMVGWTDVAHFDPGLPSVRMPVAIDGSTAVVGSSTAALVGVNSGVAYVYARTSAGWVQQAMLVTSDTAQYQAAGWSVAIDGDRILIGAGGVPAGVYVFERVGTTWTEVAKLTPSSHVPPASGQYTVALEGTRAVVGAPFTDGELVHVFERQVAGWAEVQSFTGSDTVDHDGFGSSLALAADVLIVGAPFDAEPLEESGAAFVFERTAGTWAEVRKLTPNVPGFHDGFGSSVAVDGKYAVVGNPGDNWGMGLDRGSAFVYARTSSGWDEVRRVAAFDSDANDVFGWSVAISGMTVFICSMFDDDAGPNAGAIYVHRIVEPFTSYCTSSPNSTGLPGLICVDGTSEIAVNDLELIATGVPDQPGIFFYGPLQANSPLGNGTLCVNGVITRLPVVAGSGGELRYVLDLSNLPAGGAVAPGDTRYFQAWFRDPAAGGAFFDLTNAMQVQFLP